MTLITATRAQFWRACFTADEKQSITVSIHFAGRCSARVVGREPSGGATKRVFTRKRLEGFCLNRVGAGPYIVMARGGRSLRTVRTEVGVVFPHSRHLPRAQTLYPSTRLHPQTQHFSLIPSYSWLALRISSSPSTSSHLPAPNPLPYLTPRLSFLRL